MIAALASLPHYRAHIAPIMEALPDRLRGPIVDHPDQLPDSDATFVAGFVDLAAIPRRRQIIYVEHGAGQTYDGANPYQARHPSYSGSNNPQFGRVALFICPNEVVAGRWNRMWPDTPAVAVGCPKLDRWHRPVPAPTEPRTVAWTFHWGATLDFASEAKSAIDYYRADLPRIVAQLAADGIRVLGHEHPRWAGALEQVWADAGADYTGDPAVVMSEASVLIADNTSFAPEFASLDRPVVWLNCPWYRRGVNHGGRFWEWVDGQPQADRPDEVFGLTIAALNETDRAKQVRRDMVNLVYSHTDGTAAVRAAKAVEATVG